jgi:hypothetical protein
MALMPLLDVAGIMRVDRPHVDPERRRHRLNGAQLSAPSARRGIANYSYPRNCRRDLFEQLQPFGADTELELGKAGGIASGRARVATRPAPTGSVTFTNTIGRLRLALCNAAVMVAPEVSTTSGS